MKTYFNSSILPKFLVCICFISFGLFTTAQESVSVSIQWKSPQTMSYGDQEYLVPSIDGQFLDGYCPNFFFKQPVVNSIGSVDVSIVSTSSATSADLKYLEQFHIQVPTEAKIAAQVTRQGTEKFAVIDLMPFVSENGQVKRITAFDVKFKKGINATNLSAASKGFATNSVLTNGSGQWYKISVKDDGIYKIDRDFLASLGIDVDNLNPQHINVYGNGDGLLPELNSIPRTDDLAKNGIQVVGESDGSFDSNDYILFYGWGPHRWYDDGTKFYQERHVYSDVSCYYININPSGTPSRIESVFESPNATTDVVTDYNFYGIYEQDLVSLSNGGSRWYGELFDLDLTKFFAFSVPDVISSEPAKFEVSLASNANTTSGNTQTYRVGGTQLFTSSLPTGTDYGRSTNSFNYDTPTPTMSLQITITRNSPNILAYLDRITLNARRSLKFMGSQFLFGDLNSVGPGNVAEYSVQNLPSNGFVWEVTDRHQPWLVNGTNVGGTYTFRMDSDSLRSFVASNGTTFLTPTAVGPVAFQNLHGLEQADYVIVTHSSFVSQAERLANLHRAEGLVVHVATTDQIYNEFSSGMQDATAIRMFAKMFYDRGQVLPGPKLKHLCLFGDGTYDPKNRVANNNNYIVTYQMNGSSVAEDHIGNMPSDDYFGILGDNEAINSTDLVDIGVGRMLVSDAQMGKELVDKVEHYMKNGSSIYSTANTNCSSDEYSSTFGDWRSKYVLIADDEENNYFLVNDVEPQYNYVSDSLPEMNCEKIYLDAYQQVATAGGSRYPDVNDAITAKIERGALVINYVGHGGEVGVAEERVITVPMIQDWRNIDVLPLMVSATCEFTKFDDPDRVSAGEWASLNPYGAAIALMTTTRSVYFNVNTNIGQAFIRNVFQRDTTLKPRAFGEIIMHTKNSVGGNNKRSFTLIGDPALRLALPNFSVVTDSINGQDPALFTDTVKALSHVTVKGHVRDYNGVIMSGFNGVVYPTVFDKPKAQQTLGNDSGSPVYTFETQTNKVYTGKASVTNGMFEFSFIVPKDINYSVDYGKISYYAENGTTDAFGYDTSFLLGGLNANGLADNIVPTIDLYINDENFVSGGITDETPILIADLFDESGINTVGNGVGHDLIAVLDGETGNPIVLNDFYTSDLDSYQSGKIRYNFASLDPGPHTLSLKVWDVNNNSAEVSIEFVVEKQENFVLDHVLNYPNPFTTHTDFYFEHNQACCQLDVQIQVLTVAGSLVKTINTTVLAEGFRSEGIPWDGLDDFGDQLAKGVYVYRMRVRNPDGEIAEKLEKLVILR